MNRKYKVFLTQPIHEAGLNKLSEECIVEIKNFSEDVSEDEIIKYVKDVDAIITRLPRITRKIIENAPELKVIGRHGVGYDNIDIKAATEKSIPVVYTPEAPCEPVAEHVIGFIIALSKNIVIADKALRKHTWIGWEVRHKYIGKNIKGKTLGIIGLGRIGALVAKYAKCLGMKIIYYDIYRKTDIEKLLDISYRELEDLLKESDFVSLNVPLTKSTEKLIGEKELRLMKKTAYLINTSRGKVIDEEALIKALKEGWIAGAALDVFEKEPISKDNPLIEFDNVILSPHMSAHTEEFFIDAAVTIAEDVLRVLKGKKPLYIVNPEVYSIKNFKE
ncbi:MAG: hydroxyacid dehydrogenase [Nitrososphaerota archaeon]